MQQDYCKTTKNIKKLVWLKIELLKSIDYILVSIQKSEELSKYSNYLHNTKLVQLTQTNSQKNSKQSIKNQNQIMIQVCANNQQLKVLAANLFQCSPQQNSKQKQKQFESIDSNNFSSLSSHNSPQFLRKIRKAFKNSSNQQNILKLTNRISIELFNPEISKKSKDEIHSQSCLVTYFRFQINKLLYSKQTQGLNLFVVADHGLIQEQDKMNSCLFSPMHHKLYVSSFFNAISQSPNLWPYRFSLRSIQRLFNVFFNQCNVQFQFSFDKKQKKIIKLSNLPLIKFSQKTLQKSNKISNSYGQTQITIFNGIIFKILQNQQNQAKCFYGIPSTSNFKNSQKQDIRLQQIIETFLSLGFKISQIKQLIYSFSTIMNLSCISIEQYTIIANRKKQVFVKFKQDDVFNKILQISKCDELTLSKLILQKQNQFGMFPISKSKAVQNVRTLMQVIWETTLQHLSTQLNSKLTSNKYNSCEDRKTIIITCFNNSASQDNSLNLQEGQELQIQYNQISKYIWKNIVQDNSNPNPNSNFKSVLKTKTKTIQNNIQNSSDLQKSFNLWKQLKIEQIYSLINLPFIKIQQDIKRNYNKMKNSTQTRKFIQEIIGDYVFQDYTKKLFMFFKNIFNQDSKQENHFLIKINYQKFLKQIQSNQLFKFIQGLVLKNYSSDSKFYSSVKKGNTTNLNVNVNVNVNQSSKDSKIYQSSKQDINCDDFDLIVMKPTSISIDVTDFVKNYMYTTQLRKIHRKFDPAVKQFKYPIQVNKLKLSLLKQLKNNKDQSIDTFQCQLTQFQTIEVSQDTFNNLEFESIKITNFPRRLINQFRAYKFRKRFLKNLHVFYCKKKFLDKMNKFIMNKKKAYFCYFKKRVGATFTFQVACQLYKNYMKSTFQKLNAFRIYKTFCNLVSKIYKKVQIQQKKQAFIKLKNSYQKIQSAKKINNILSKLQIYKQAKRAFLTNLINNKKYQLIITSPRCGKFSYNNLRIEVNEANHTVSHAGNTSTSNVKSSLSYGTKGFNKINLMPIQQQDSISSHQSQQVKQSQKKSSTLKQQKKRQSQVQVQDKDKDKDKNKSKASLSGSKASQLSNSLVSQKSEMIDFLKKQELYLIKDYPHFSFQIWYDQSVNFKKTKSQPSKTCQILFKKIDSQKSPSILQKQKQIDQDQTIKQRIMVHSFSNYLKDHINMSNGQQKVQDVMKAQDNQLKDPLLKQYPLTTRPTLYKQIFNVILKLGFNKNTSKSYNQLLNLIIKPIKQLHNEEMMKTNNLFNDEPLMTNNYYSSDYNTIKDQMFLQFIKQIIGNDDMESIKSLLKSLQIITRHLYPSNIFLYSFLGFLKVSQTKRPELYEPIYRNMLLVVQAAQGNKGTKVKIYKDEINRKAQMQYAGYLYLRSTQIQMLQCMKRVVIKIKLANEVCFQYQVKNQIFKCFKRKVLQQIGLYEFQQNYALFQCKGINNYSIIEDKTKVIDFLMMQKQKQSKKSKFNQVYLKIRHYYPIKIRQINHLRMFYLNMITDQGRLPWKMDQYQNIVALSMFFDQFQQLRISNYLTLSKKLTNSQNSQPDLTKIQARYAAIANQGSKKISEFQYFKKMKESNFLLSKCYRQQEEKKEINQEIRIIIKPKQLCFYQGKDLKSSINLNRIKSVFFQNNQISMQLIYSSQERQGASQNQFIGQKRILIIKGFYKIKQLFDDILYYGQLLIK